MEPGPEILGAVAWLTVTIIGAAWALFQSTNRSISELKSEIGKLRGEVSGLGDDITSLRERTSSLEAKVQLLTQFAFPPETKKE